MSIKEKLVNVVVEQAMKKNPNVKLSEDKKAKVKELTMLLVNKGISQPAFEIELHKVLGK
jgi:hypothetical protein